MHGAQADAQHIRIQAQFVQRGPCSMSKCTSRGCDSQITSMPNYNFDIRVLLCDYLSIGRAGGCLSIAHHKLHTFFISVSMLFIDCLQKGARQKKPCHEIRYLL
jgi:hypothetical protein